MVLDHVGTRYQTVLADNHYMLTNPQTVDKATFVSNRLDTQGNGTAFFANAGESLTMIEHLQAAAATLSIQFGLGNGIMPLEAHVHAVQGRLAGDANLASTAMCCQQ